MSNILKTCYDIIIIGAGPAGLECAAGLAGSGRSVLLIEKNDVIGPKVCGGGLTALADKFDIPDEITRVFNVVKLKIGQRSLSLELKNPIKTLSRYDLGQYQLSKIKNCTDIEIVTGLKVLSVDNSHVKTEKWNFSYKFLVGADGYGSVVRKHLGLPSGFVTGMVYQIDGVDEDLRWVVDAEKMGSGYIWIFPNKNGVNTGIFFDIKNMKASQAKEMLDEFLSSKGILSGKNEIRNGKINYKYSGVSFGSIFLAGDAAGLALKSTGEGIPGALISGREVAEKILDNKYTMSKLNAYLKIKRRREALLQIFELFPFMQSFLFNLYASYKNWTGKKWRKSST